nr:MAG TPA: hypothetical protein [Caudoviricetes sp.]
MSEKRLISISNVLLPFKKISLKIYLILTDRFKVG